MKLPPDTFSKKIRKYIEWNRYCELQNLLEKDSLIAREKISDQDVVRRIEVLEEFENNYRFEPMNNYQTQIADAWEVLKTSRLIRN